MPPAQGRGSAACLGGVVGHGAATFALSRGADVLGVDIASNLVEAGNRRARDGVARGRWFACCPSSALVVAGNGTTASCLVSANCNQRRLFKPLV